MRISQNGINLIKRWEGCKLKAYRDVKGVWTIGWGTTNPKYAFEGNEITQAQADHLFMQDVLQFSREIESLIKAKIHQHHWDALVSLAYNIGSRAFGNSTLLKRLNAGDYIGAQQQFPRWIYSGGKVYQGLVNRRNDEANLFARGTLELDERRRELNAKESEQIQPTPASTNVVPDSPPNPGNRVGTAVGTVATAGALKEASESLAPLASYSEYLGWVFVIVTIAALVWALRERKQQAG